MANMASQLAGWKPSRKRQNAFAIAIEMGYIDDDNVGNFNGIVRKLSDILERPHSILATEFNWWVV